MKYETVVKVKRGYQADYIRYVADEIKTFLLDFPGVISVRYGLNNAPNYRHLLLSLEIEDENALKFLIRSVHKHEVMLALEEISEAFAVTNINPTADQFRYM